MQRVYMECGTKGTGVQRPEKKEEKQSTEKPEGDAELSAEGSVS